MSQGFTNVSGVVGIGAAVSVYDSTTQSIPHNTDTPVNYDTELYDTASMHDTVTNNTRLTAPLAGKYVITANIAWAANATGIRQLQFRKNGTTALAVTRLVPNDGVNQAFNSLATVATLNAGDYVEAVAFQTSGAGLNTDGQSYNTFSMTYLGSNSAISGPVYGSGTVNYLSYWSDAQTLSGSTNLKFDGTDLILGSGIRVRMDSQNRVRYLNSMAKGTLASTQVITASAWTTLNMGAEEFDTDSLHDTVTNNSRIKANLTGKYLVCAGLNWTGSPTNNPGSPRALVVSKNAAGVFGAGTLLCVDGRAVVTGIGTGNAALALTSMTSGDYVEAFVFNGDSGNDTLSTTITFLGLYYIGE